MLLDSFWQVFIGGFVGGSFSELLDWWKLRKCPPDKLPLYRRYRYYWCITILMWLAGGGWAVLYGTHQVNAILAVHIGISAPLIIEKFSSTIPKMGDIGQP